MGLPACDCVPPDGDDLSQPWPRECEHHRAQRNKLDIAMAMLAEWCVAVDVDGTGWDDWDEHYRYAMYRPGPLRELLDKAISEARARRPVG